MNERIKELRKALGLTQQEFADRLGISRNNIATYETRKTGPGNSVIKLICNTFNVDETWLRTGAGEMFIQPQGREEEIKHMVENLLQGRKAEFKYRLISVLNSLNESQWEVLEGYMKQIVGNQEEPPESMTIEQEKAAKKAAYMKMVEEQYDSQQEQASQALSANESDVG